ncbi:MAG TPA: adenylyltransferase/cytidyltransferase family protein, partial [Acidimicrobiales bacterium]|nr:adenylyltransferase/cytidyltransferase family protein [Acidimicrobiales bacterium]
MNPARFTVYADMVGDLFHSGHVSFLRRARALAESRAGSASVWMIVGLMSDSDASRYKRRPVLSLVERRQVVEACRLVDQVIAPCPLRVDRALIDA